MDKQQSVPIGVRIISILYYIGTGALVIAGLFFLFGAGLMGSIAEQIPLIATLGAGLFIVAGILLIGFAVLSFFVARGLWKVRPWARIVVIIFSILGVLGAITGMIQGNILNNTFNLVINGVIGGYLLFSKSVKQIFC